MRKLTFVLLWMVIFSIPLEQITSIPLIGSITRFLGIAAAGVGLLTSIADGQFRRFNGILLLACVFVAQSVLSLLWTLSYAATLERSLTYVQLLAFAWLICEFVSRREQYYLLIAAYCLGAYVAFVNLLINFLSGTAYMAGEVRYSANSLDPNDLGLTLAIGIPMSWLLYLNGKGFLRLIGLCYAPLAAIGIVLTGSRGASLAGLVALTVIPLTSVGMSRRALVATVVSLVIAAAVISLVPQSTLARIATFGADLESGDFGGRGVIWSTAFRMFLERPMLGIGAGAFSTVLEPTLGRGNSPHNTFIAILVEQGAIGFACFALLIGAWFFLVSHLRSQHRTIWFILIATWAVGSMSLNWEYRKNGWLLFGLAAVQVALAELRADVVAHSKTLTASRRDHSTLPIVRSPEPYRELI